MMDEQAMPDVIYLDHAATSWPKPKAVIEAVQYALLHESANPGRGSHRLAVQASRVLFQTRKSLARLLGVANPNDIAFAGNTTEALNLAIKGYLKPGDHVISTSVEHNSIRRPLEYLRRTIGIEITYLQSDAAGHIRPEQVEQALTQRTTLLAAAHSSNLLGTILPIGEIGSITRRHGVKLLVDAAQSAGILPIDVVKMGIDLLAFPGHKGLLGPQGTGGLYIHPEVELTPLLHGGTGSQSEAVDQPDVRPDRYESGTLNTPGIAGLRAGVELILDETVEKIHTREWALTRRMLNGLSAIEGVRLLGPPPEEERTGIVAFLIGECDASEAAFILDRHYGIAVRSGYHCTPLGHGSAGTQATGAVRASIGYTTTETEVDALIAAVGDMIVHYR